MTQAVIVLTRIANSAAGIILAPMAVLPGWLSSTILAAVCGIGMTLVFRYTSNQQAIRRARRAIRANVLAMSLFHQSLAVTLRSQIQVLRGTGRLLLLAIVPVLIMVIPTLLVLGQIGARFQARPFVLSEHGVVSVTLKPTSTWPSVTLEAHPAVEVVAGPVRIESQQMLCWDLRVLKEGYHKIAFDVSGARYDKELAIGDRLMRTSRVRPPADWQQVLQHPCETPFSEDSPIQSIEIQYPDRKGWTSGTDHWVLYWFGMSMLVALGARRLWNVEF